MQEKMGVVEILADQIIEPHNAMRSELDRDGLLELADDIKINGLINPITVRPVRGCKNCRVRADEATDAHTGHEIADMFEIVAGHRRFRAMCLIPRLQIPCVVRELEESSAFMIMASENLKRSDVNPVDEADFIFKIAKETGKGLAEIAQIVGRSRQYVEDRMIVAEMPDYMKFFLKEGAIKLGVAIALMEVDNDEIRKVWVEQAVRDGVSVPMAKFWVAGYLKDRAAYGTESAAPPEGAPAAEYRPIKFSCAVDGREYPASECEAVFVHKSNMPVLHELRVAIISERAAASNPPHQNEPSASVPVGAGASF
jgi:ParB family chromosome partitioning protein